VNKAKVLKEIRGWTLTILGVLAFRTFLYEAVYIPSGSMLPTLEIGDYVIVEKWAYGARLPFTEAAQAMWRTPKRGDIVVLLPPQGNPRNDDLIKRVVAIGGDVVEIRDGALYLNDQPVPRPKVEGQCFYDNVIERPGPEGRSEREWQRLPCVAHQETLGDHKYVTYCTPDSPCQDVPRTTVPADHVWLAGDHRDHSADSRVFGPVPVGRIKGRAWIALGSWGPDGLRWNRLFHLVNH
jgi:signal peptidase I